MLATGAGAKAAQDRQEKKLRHQGRLGFSFLLDRPMVSTTLKKKGYTTRSPTAKKQRHRALFALFRRPVAKARLGSPLTSCRRLSVSLETGCDPTAHGHQVTPPAGSARLRPAARAPRARPPSQPKSSEGFGKQRELRAKQEAPKALRSNALEM